MLQALRAADFGCVQDQHDHFGYRFFFHPDKPRWERSIERGCSRESVAARP